MNSTSEFKISAKTNCYVIKSSFKGTDSKKICKCLCRMLHREAFDKKGLIYGMGHAVYSISDPRAEIFKRFVQQLAHEKGRDKDFALYSMVPPDAEPAATSACSLPL